LLVDQLTARRPTKADHGDIGERRHRLVWRMARELREHRVPKAQAYVLLMSSEFSDYTNARGIAARYGARGAD